MLTLRDCFVIAGLFALVFAWLKLGDRNAACFLFVPAAYGAWLFCARSRSLHSPLARIALAGLLGGVAEVTLSFILDLVAKYDLPNRGHPTNSLIWAMLLLTGFGLCGGLLFGILAEVFLQGCRLRIQIPFDLRDRNVR